MRPCQKSLLCACALVLAASMIGAEFLALAHQVTAHHVYCAAHGHMIDASEAAAEAMAGREVRIPGQPSLSSGAQQREHAHVHCDKFVFLQSGELPMAAPARFAERLLAEVRPLPPEVMRPAAIDLLRLAPKNSPPLAG